MYNNCQYDIKYLSTCIYITVYIIYIICCIQHIAVNMTDLNIYKYIQYTTIKNTDSVDQCYVHQTVQKSQMPRAIKTDTMRVL